MLGGVNLAHQVYGMAIVALGQGMMFGELDPVFSLVRRHDSAPSA